MQIVLQFLFFIMRIYSVSANAKRSKIYDSLPEQRKGIFDLTWFSDQKHLCVFSGHKIDRVVV